MYGSSQLRRQRGRTSCSDGPTDQIYPISGLFGSHKLKWNTASGVDPNIAGIAVTDICGVERQPAARGMNYILARQNIHLNAPWAFVVVE